MTSETRVVLVKPGDLLTFGNLGDIGTAEDAEALQLLAGDLKERLGLAHVLAFEADIDLAMVARDGTGA